MPRLSLTVELSGQEVVLQGDIANLDVAANDPRQWVVILVGDNNNHVRIYDRFP